jgi:hypothetical protein
MEEPLYSPALRRVAIGACSALVVLVLLGVCYAMPGQPAPAVAVTALALAVGTGGIGWHVARPRQTRVPSWVLLTAAGLAGAVIVGLVPNSSGYLIVFVTICALGMELPLATAFATGLAVAAAANIAFLLAGDLYAQLDPSVRRRLLDALSSGSRFAVAASPAAAAPPESRRFPRRMT